MKMQRYWRQYSLLLVVVLALFALAASNIVGRHMTTATIYSGQELTGGAFFPDTTNWYKVGEYQYFGLYLDLNTDSTYFAQAISDSLGYDIDYELAWGNSKPSANSATYRGANGYWKKGETQALEIMSVVIGDTVNGGRWYQSLHDGTADISPAMWVRFILTADANMKLLSTNLEMDLGLERQP